ncbi:MAG: 6-bladed beta-propeller [Balneolaceae bacterium]|nr:6-bladed beta-propeller [Balneolaceae bacterium]
MALTILIIIQACSSSPEIEVPEDIAAMENVAVFSGMEEPQFDISLTEEARFGDTDTVFISSISGIAVDNNGNLFLADRSEATVHAYTPEGEYKFSVGRSGEGPGEFNAAYQPRMHNGELYVLDINQQRMSIFDPSDGTYLRAQPLGSGGPDTSGFPVRAEPLDEGRLLVFFNQMQGEGETYYNNRIPRILDEEGNVFRSGFIEFRPSEMHMIRNDNAIQMISLPFMGSSYADITPDDHIIWGFSDRLLLHEVNLEGEVIRSIYYSRESPPLDREGILANYEDEVLKDALRQIDFPENRQAFTAVTVDDEGRIWLTLPTVNEEENEVWVLAETGEKLAAFTRPATDQLELVKDGYVYFRVTEEETGIVEVVKYRFDL